MSKNNSIYLALTGIIALISTGYAIVWAHGGHGDEEAENLG